MVLLCNVAIVKRWCDFMLEWCYGEKVKDYYGETVKWLCDDTTHGEMVKGWNGETVKWWKGEMMK